MTQTYGRSTRGTRVVAGGPFGRWETTTFVGALRSTGFVAQITVDGPINGRVFATWVQQHLVPTLFDGDVVIMDTLSSYKVPRVREAIEPAGTEVCYLPLYSHDLNPIELASQGSRNACETVANGQSINCGIYEAHHSTGFTDQECRNYFKYGGYR